MTTPDPSSETDETPRWRLLCAGETIQAADQVLHDNCTHWLRLAGWEIGMTYNPGFFVPMRRPLSRDPGLGAHPPHA